MDTKQLNKALYEKMSAEQEQYRADLVGKTPAEILSHAYEYAMREDILIEAEVVDLPARQAAALLESPSPLADAYKIFCEMNTNHMNIIRESIEQRADDLLRAAWEDSRAIPLYQQSGRYAMNHGEFEVFRASCQANEACKKAIEATIQAGFDGMHLTADAKGILAEFGPERVTYVLAATIQDKDWDERFSRSNKAWASAVPMFETEDRRCAYVVNIHSTVLNGFVDMVRKELDAMREQPEQTAKRPSIKAQLAAKPVPGDQSSKPKNRETR